MKKYFLIIFLISLLNSCVKDKMPDTIQPYVDLSSSKKVFVINEGNYGSANSSISLFDSGNSAVIENFYQSQNIESPIIGDVAQSLSKINGKFYLVVNNSGKIIVCDNQLKKINQITNLPSPRYVLPITNQKAYVSNYNGNIISIIDLNSNTVMGSIPCSGWTEKMAIIYNKAYITNMRRNYTYIINTLTDIKIDSIEVGINSGSIVIDKNDKIWVLSSGDNINSKLARLSRINSITNEIEFVFQFETNDSPNSLNLNKTKDTLFYINDGIFKMPINSNLLPTSPFINSGNKNFYSIDVNHNTGHVFAIDAMDYVQKSNIYIYDAFGNQKLVFKAGIISNGFYFE